MSKPLPATALRVGLVVLAGGGLATGVAAASSAATAPPVNHQLCYTAGGAPFNVPARVRLVDQFSPKGFVPKINPGAVLHCNPAVKIASGRVFKITNPAAHLACFQISPPTQQPTPTVVVTNQFGSAVLRPSQPNLLCVPSWKSLIGPPNKTPATPPGLSHFTCYPVSVASGAYKPPPVRLQDEFSPQPVAAQVNPVPAELCLPTAKTVGTHLYRIVNSAAHLLCFPVTPTPIIQTVFDENQFGTSKLSIRQTKWLCVPSTKKLG